MSAQPHTDSDFARAMLEALRTQPHRLSPKFLYDEAGSALFDRICDLPQYPVTRTELQILQSHGEDIAHRIGPHADLIEFGAGTSRKLRVLLGHLRSPVRYTPVDIASAHLARDAQGLRMDFPAMAVQPIAADILRPFAWPQPNPPAGHAGIATGRKVGLFLGSSLGNLDDGDMQTFLQGARQLLPGGALLLGVDLLKDPAALHAAYNDDAGVTAAFNLNVLARANRELGADFVLDRFWHHACFRPDGRCGNRMEMHLISKMRQEVHLCGHTFVLDEGESLHTETSRKFTLPQLHAQVHQAGWRPERVWTDPDAGFALQWLENSETGP